MAAALGLAAVAPHAVPYTALEAGCGASVLRTAVSAVTAARRPPARRPRECSRGARKLVDHPARLFVCARCRTHVRLCSRCDRGQRYCGRTCSRAARHDSRREAARRYQRSRAGRLAHAARSRCWRQRRRERERACREGTALDGGAINFVTHQGSATQPAGAPLAAERSTVAVCEANTPTTVTARCRRCAAPLSPWIRQGFLRHGARRWPPRVVDPSP